MRPPETAGDESTHPLVENVQFIAPVAFKQYTLSFWLPTYTNPLETAGEDHNTRPFALNWVDQIIVPDAASKQYT
jgi:hypothetical protein